MDQCSEMMMSLYSYLKKHRLCGRGAVQSFIDAPEDDVKQICSNSGWRLNDNGNFCGSNNTMTTYDVKSTQKKKHCTVVNVDVVSTQYVVVGCNKVGNDCLPVHFEKKVKTPRIGEPCMP